MPLRFRKTLSILPGLRLNISKGGPSLSVGGRGLSENISLRGTRETVGLPGSGLSYSESQGRGKGGPKSLFAILTLIAAIAYVVWQNWPR